MSSSKNQFSSAGWFTSEGKKNKNVCSDLEFKQKISNNTLSIAFWLSDVEVYSFLHLLIFAHKINIKNMLQ